MLGTFILGAYIINQHQIYNVSLDRSETCDLECANNLEKNSFKCVEVENDTFLCRQERVYESIGYTGAFPTTYGEILTFTEGLYQTASFDISAIYIIDEKSKKIEIHFAEYDNPVDILHVEEIHPGDTFLTGCTDDLEPVHLFQYMDMYNQNDITYVELWGIHPLTSSQLVPCDLATTIQESLQIDYDIYLPSYDEFGFYSK